MHIEDHHNMHSSKIIIRMISLKEEEMSGVYGLIRNSCRDMAGKPEVNWLAGRLISTWKNNANV
jgi:hypothetical protein